MTTGPRSPQILWILLKSRTYRFSGQKFVSAWISFAHKLPDCRLICMPQTVTLLKTMQRSQKNSYQLKSFHCGKSGAKWPKNKRAVWQSREETSNNAKLRKPMPAFGNGQSVNPQLQRKENTRRA